jgi:hypothetical protein
MSTETSQMNNVLPMERVGSILAIETTSSLQYLKNCLLVPDAVLSRAHQAAEG